MTTKKRDDVQQMSDGRWIVAFWSARQAQWQSSNLRASARFQGYRYTCARSLDALAREGILTYATRASASRAARRVYGAAED